MFWHRKPLFRVLSSTMLGPAWSGNTVNCVPYRTEAVLPVHSSWITAFFDDQGNIVVAQIASDGNVQATNVPSLVPPLDAHQAISLGIDDEKRLHLAYGAHNSDIIMLRGRTRVLSDGFEEALPLIASELSSDHDNSHSGLTYPMFLSAGGELLLLLRRGPHYNGEIRVLRYSSAKDQWTPDSTSLITGMGQHWTAGPYLNSPIVLNDSIFLFYVWRLDPLSTGQGEMVNIGIDFLKSSDGLRTVLSVTDLKLNLPVTPFNSDRLIAVGIGSQLINQSGATFAPSLGPVAIAYWADRSEIPQYRLVWAGPLSRGRCHQVSKFTTRFSLSGKGTLPLPHSRPRVLFDRQGYAYVFFRSAEAGNRLCVDRLSPPHYSPDRGQRQVLVDEDLGYYEPVIGQELWSSEGKVAIYVQRCGQSYGDDGRAVAESTAAHFIVFEKI